MRYLVLVFIFLTMNTQAQTLDIIIKGTPLYPGWPERINTLIKNYNDFKTWDSGRVANYIRIK